MGQVMLIYLDSNIFITYFNQEKNSCLEATNEIFKNFELGKHKIVTSVVTLMEVLPHGIKNYDDFERMTKDERINLFPIDKLVVSSAVKLRNAFYAQSRDGALRTVDTIHVASAVAAKVEYLITRDDGILKLPLVWVKSIIGGNMQIIKPPIPRSQSGSLL